MGSPGRSTTVLPDEFPVLASVSLDDLTRDFGLGMVVARKANIGVHGISSLLSCGGGIGTAATAPKDFNGDACKAAPYTCWAGTGAIVN